MNYVNDIRLAETRAMWHAAVILRSVPRISYIYFRRYLVILEERENYFLLISGFYVDEVYYHAGLIKRYKKAENAIKK